jgi:hypothetical protein
MSGQSRRDEIFVVAREKPGQAPQERQRRGSSVGLARNNFVGAIKIGYPMSRDDPVAIAPGSDICNFLQDLPFDRKLSLQILTT